MGLGHLCLKRVFSFLRTLGSVWLSYNFLIVKHIFLCSFFFSLKNRKSLEWKKMGLEVQEDGQNGNLNHIQSFQLNSGLEWKV